MSNYLEQPVLVTVKEVVFTKPGYGPGNTDHFLIVKTQDGAVANICIGAKSPINVGASFVAEPKRSQKNGQSFGIALDHDDGTKTWWQAMARQQQGGGGGYGGGNRPQQQQAFPATAAPRSGGRPEADVIADFKRVNAALGVAASDGQATSIVLGILRGEIIPTPQPQRLPMPAAKPMPQGYAPQEQQPEQDIPF